MSPTTLDNFEPLLSDRQVASITGLSVSNLRRRRLLKQEPPFIKLGFSVKYHPATIREWIAVGYTGSKREEAAR